MFTVYTKSNCQQCVATKRRLARKGIEFVEINLDEDREALRVVSHMGFASAPVVDPGDGSAWWSGFRVDLIDEFAARVCDAA